MSYAYAKELIRRDMTNLVKCKVNKLTDVDPEMFVLMICGMVEEDLIEAEVITESDVDE